MIFINGYKLLLLHVLFPSLFPKKSEVTNADHITFSAPTPQWLSYTDTLGLHSTDFQAADNCPSACSQNAAPLFKHALFLLAPQEQSDELFLCTRSATKEYRLFPEDTRHHILGDLFKPQRNIGR